MVTWKGDSAKRREAEAEVAQLRAAAAEDRDAAEGKEQAREHEMQELKR